MEVITITTRACPSVSPRPRYRSVYLTRVRTSRIDTRGRVATGAAGMPPKESSRQLVQNLILGGNPSETYSRSAALRTFR